LAKNEIANAKATQIVNLALSPRPNMLMKLTPSLHKLATMQVFIKF
jgi:hypothetical protein